MKYAQITITIEVDESKLTEEQRLQANSFEPDIAFSDEHPLQTGVDNLQDAISTISPLSYFNYLKKGSEAVTVTIGN